MAIRHLGRNAAVGANRHHIQCIWGHLPRETQREHRHSRYFALAQFREIESRCEVRRWSGIAVFGDGSAHDDKVVSGEIVSVDVRIGAF
jgi:hypothetical protein